MISWHHTWKEILSHKTRVLLTLLAIAWGTVSIACMLAIGEGLRTTFSHALKNLGEAAITISPGVTTRPYQGFNSGQPVQLNQTDVKLLKSQVRGIQQIIPINNTMLQMNYRGKSITGNVIATPENYNQIYPIQLTAHSRFFSPIDIKLASRMIVLGQQFVDALFQKNTNPIGKIIQLNGQAFTVIGEVPKTNDFVVGSMPNYYLAFIPITTYHLLSQTQHYSNIIVVLKSGTNKKIIENKIRQVIAFHHHVDPTDTGIISFFDQSQTQETFNHFMWGLQIFLGIIGIITLVIAGVGVANVMFASINQAVRDIGVRIALGAKSYHIVIQYVIESLWVTLFGGLIGILFSYLIVKTLRHIPLHSTYFKQFGSPYPILSLSVIFVVITVLGLVGFFAGFFPARKASLINPVEALRNE